MANEIQTQIADAAAAADAWLIKGARTRDRIGNAASDNMRFGFTEGFKAARQRGEAAQGEQQAVARVVWRDGKPAAWEILRPQADGASDLYTRPQPAAALSAAPAAPESMRDWSLRMTERESGQNVSAGAHGIADEPAAPDTGDDLQFGPRLRSGGSIEGKAKAWDDVLHLMDEVCPDWPRGALTGSGAVRRAIREMSEAAKAAPAPVAGDAVAKLPPLPQAFFDEFGICADDRVQDYAYAALAQDRASQGAAAGVPEGWRLVPVQPTVEMLDAGFVADRDAETHKGHARWDAMLAAAPSAPTQGAEREVG